MSLIQLPTETHSTFAGFSELWPQIPPTRSLYPHEAMQSHRTATPNQEQKSGGQKQPFCKTDVNPDNLLSKKKLIEIIVAITESEFPGYLLLPPWVSCVISVIHFPDIYVLETECRRANVPKKSRFFPGTNFTRYVVLHNSSF